MQDIIETPPKVRREQRQAAGSWTNHDAAPAESLVEFLARLEAGPHPQTSAETITAYQTWIARHGTASTALHAAWFNLGVALSAGGDRLSAIDAYRQALNLRPDCHAAAHNLGLCLEATGAVDAALAVWQAGLQSDSDRAALNALRASLSHNAGPSETDRPTILRLGADVHPPSALLRPLQTGHTPPVPTTDLARLPMFEDETIGIVLAGQAITALPAHQVHSALRDIHRVLQARGVAVITVTDLQSLAVEIAQGRLTEPLLMTSAGPAAPLDLLYGAGTALASGLSYQACRTGFTGPSLAKSLVSAGFAAVLVQRDPERFSLTAVAFRTPPEGDRLQQGQRDLLPAAGQPATLYRPGE